MLKFHSVIWSFYSYFDEYIIFEWRFSESDSVKNNLFKKNWNEWINKKCCCIKGNKKVSTLSQSCQHYTFDRNIGNTELAWKQTHNNNIRKNDTYIRRVHSTHFKDFKSINK